jgi:hypothetical protein
MGSTEGVSAEAAIAATKSRLVRLLPAIVLSFFEAEVLLDGLLNFQRARSWRLCKSTIKATSSETQSESKEDSRLRVFFTRVVFLGTTEERAAGE